MTITLCTSCALADNVCPSFPNPVDHCQQYRPHLEAKRWWEHLDERRPDELEGD